MNLNKQSKKAIRKAYVKYRELMQGWDLLDRHHKEFDLKVICSSLRLLYQIDHPRLGIAIFPKGHCYSLF